MANQTNPNIQQDQYAAEDGFYPQNGGSVEEWQVWAEEQLATQPAGSENWTTKDWDQWFAEKANR
jgi:hypothetical protein